MRTTILPARARATPPNGDATRSPGTSSSAARWRTVLETAAVLVVAGGFCALVQGPLWRQDAQLAVVNLRTSLAFVCAGSLLRKDKGQRGVALALMLAGIFRSVDFIYAWNGPWPAFALVIGGVDRIFGAWALLRYPNPSLLRHQRIYLVLVTGWMLIGQALIAVTSTAAWNGGRASWWWPSLLPDEQLSDVLNYVVNAGLAAFGVALIVLLAMRLIRSRGMDRITLTPVIVAGIAAVIAAIASAVALMLDGLATSPDGVYTTESLVDVAVPLAFLLAVVQRALLLRNLTALAEQVSSGTEVADVRHALRSALHDPTLDVVDLSADDADGDASAAMPDDGSPERLVEFIRTESGTPIAVVIADPALERHRGVFDAAVRTSGLALRNAQLQTQAARERLEQVRASRARVIEAELAERRRFERDLHDGVQQHLLSITARLSAAMTETSDPRATAAFRQASEGLREVLGELRDFAQGVHPASLSSAGLGAALEEVAERLPVSAQVTVPTARLPEPVEMTLYFVACEALTNVVKHANADSVSLTVRILESEVQMKITDDGIGGIAADVDNGRGLVNMRDRVQAIDGEIAITSPPGGGTRLEVTIPCG
jgi:signal transduction histidine kinase